MNIRFTLYFPVFCLVGLMENASKSLHAADMAGPEPIIEKRLASIQIRATADSWKELISVVHPAFAWVGEDNSHSMLWVHETAAKQPSFELDRAFGYRDDKLHWVLLRNPMNESLRRAVSGSHIQGIAKLLNEKPSPACDSCGNGNYAVIVTNQNYGTVFEIGWEGIMGEGSGHFMEERRLYVLKDKAGQWKFIGEGPSESRGKAGWSCQQSRTAVTTVRQDNGSPLGFEIRFTKQTYSTECQEDPRHVRLRDRVEFLDGVLDGASPRIRWSSHPYLIAETEETLDGLIEHLSTWTLGWARNQPGEHEKIRQTWRRELTRLNPDINAATIKRGERITILTYSEILSALQKKPVLKK